MNPLITAFLQMFTINSCNTNINANFTTNVNVNVNYDINLDLTLAVSITASFAVCIASYFIGKWIVRRFNNCIYNHRTTKTNQKYPSVNL